MTRVRALDDDHDWTFGKGANDYKRNRDAVAQNITTRLSAVTGDCYFDADAGIDWFNLLGNKDETAINLAVSSVILNTENVTGVIRVASVRNPRTRAITINYAAQTTFGPVADQFQFNQNRLA